MDTNDSMSLKITTIILLSAIIIVDVLNLNITSEYIYLAMWVFLFLYYLIVKKQKFTFQFNILQKIFILFILFGFVSTAINKMISTIDYFHSTSSYYVEQYIIPFIVIYLLTRVCDRRFFLKAFRNIMVIFSMIGLFEYITKIQFYTKLINASLAVMNFQKYGNANLINYRTTLIFYHPIYYGTLLVVTLTILFYYPIKNKTIQAIALFLVIINLILTGSRSSWFGSLLVLFVWICKRGRLNKIAATQRIFRDAVYIGCGMLLLVCIAFFNPNFTNSISEVVTNRMTSLSQSNASGARVANLNLIFYMNNFHLALLGGGMNFGKTLLMYHPSIDNWTSAVDNQFLTFILDYGIIGFLLFFTFLLECIFLLKKSKSTINSAVLTSVIAISFCSYFFEFFTSNNIINYLFFILICFYIPSSEKVTFRR